jgi:hypothetical protein
MMGVFDRGPMRRGLAGRSGTLGSTLPPLSDGFEPPRLGLTAIILWLG